MCPAPRGSCFWTALPLGSDGIGTQGALPPSTDLIPFFDWQTPKLEHQASLLCLKQYTCHRLACVPDALNYLESISQHLQNKGTHLEGL